MDVDHYTVNTFIHKHPTLHLIVPLAFIRNKLHRSNPSRALPRGYTKKRTRDTEKGRFQKINGVKDPKYRKVKKTIH
jgi:hypothetical protein